MSQRKKILTMPVDSTSISETVARVLDLSQNKKGAYVCVSNVHMCMETFDSPEFRKVVSDADLVIPDGRPIYWGQRILGDKSARQVRGQDIMNALCGVSAEEKINIGLYGGASEDVLNLVVTKLEEQFPDIRISYKFSPPFRPLTESEDQSVVESINRSDVNVLFVGVGCPKQEYWMAAHKERLNCVMLGVGAAYDFISGHKKHAPKYLQVAGLEWLFRLLSEPRRLWKRYLKQNPRFIYHFFQQWLFGKHY